VGQGPGARLRAPVPVAPSPRSVPSFNHTLCQTLNSRRERWRKDVASGPSLPLHCAVGSSFRCTRNAPCRCLLVTQDDPAPTRSHSAPLQQPHTTPVHGRVVNDAQDPLTMQAGVTPRQSSPSDTATRRRTGASACLDLQNVPWADVKVWSTANMRSVMIDCSCFF
jgi:hypothetical protein